MGLHWKKDLIILLSAPHSNWFLDAYISCDSTFLQTNILRENEFTYSTSKFGGGVCI
jgi:hypothetical protein